MALRRIKTDIKTHLYGEIIDAITRQDDTIIAASIDAAISEAKGYLSDYDIATIFAQTGSARHPLLLTLIKDMAVWHFLSLSNPSADLQLRRSRYERSIEWLHGVQKRTIIPDLPPIPVVDNITGSIRFGSNDPRVLHF